MQRFSMLCVLIVAGLVGCTDDPQTRHSPSPTTEEFLVVLSADSGSFSGQTLTLRNVPHVLYFANRPDRVVRHGSLADFAAAWNNGPDSFADDPPNATLNIYNATGDDVVITLRKPDISGSEIRFRIDVIDGLLPDTFGKASLFIDAFPTSVNNQITD